MGFKRFILKHKLTLVHGFMEDEGREHHILPIQVSSNGELVGGFAFLDENTKSDSNMVIDTYFRVLDNGFYIGSVRVLGFSPSGYSHLLYFEQKKLADVDEFVLWLEETIHNLPRDNFKSFLGAPAEDPEYQNGLDIKPLVAKFEEKVRKIRAN